MLEDIAPGEEISNNYGPRNNEQRMSAAANIAKSANIKYSADELWLLPTQQSLRLPHRETGREVR